MAKPIICSTCRGNGVRLVPGGIGSCTDCNGTGYAGDKQLRTRLAAAEKVCELLARKKNSLSFSDLLAALAEWEATR